MEGRVAIGPDLIAAKDALEVHVLTEGPPRLAAALAPLENHLIDTTVEYVAPGAVPKVTRRWTTLLHFAEATFLIGVACYLGWIFTHSEHMQVSLSTSSARAGQVLEADISGIPNGHAEVLFMGRAQPVDGRSVSLEVPSNARPGSYIVVVIATGGGYTTTATASFDVR
jgi:hypothetical protein